MTKFKTIKAGHTAMTKDEIKARIREIGEEIGGNLQKEVLYEDSKKGRGGSRCYLPTEKRGISIEVIGYAKADPYQFIISFAVKRNSTTVDGSGRPGVLSVLREKIIKKVEGNSVTNFIGVDHPKFDRLNPRVCEYSIDNIKTLWELVHEQMPDVHLSDIENTESRGRKLFSRDYSLERIVGRYRYAIGQKDQVLLDLSRKLLEADEMDHIIAVNHKVSPYTYREHVVPCIKLHNLILKMIHDEDCDDAEIIDLLERNLKIVHIHEGEAKTLNNGLRTDMPQGWSPNHSPYARLIKHNIPVRDIKNGVGLGTETWEGESLVWSR